MDNAALDDSQVIDSLGFPLLPPYGLPYPPMRLPEQDSLRIDGKAMRVTYRSHDPNIALIDGFLSDRECDQLIELSRSRLTVSQVMDNSNGKTELSSVRTSKGMWFFPNENAIVRSIDRRVCALLGESPENLEWTQVLSYARGDRYDTHHDYFPPTAGNMPIIEAQGQRIATFLLYLNEPTSGGETVFTNLRMTIPPKKGSALYFEYLDGHSRLDARLRHAGMPVLRGEKWIATKWVRRKAWEPMEIIDYGFAPV